MRARGSAYPRCRSASPPSSRRRCFRAWWGGGRAARLAYTGERIGAQQGYDWGLVDSLAPEGALDDALARTVDTICAAAPDAIRLQKALLREWEALPLRDAVARGVEAFPEPFAGGEPRRRMRAFLDRKR